MEKKLRSKKVLVLSFILFLTATLTSTAQTYDWTGAVDGNFYNAANWSSTSGPVAFDDSAFKFVRTHNVGAHHPIISSFTAWRPGVFDNTEGELTVNADFNVYFNDVLNGTVTVNTGAIFTCSNIFRIGASGPGILNVNGGTFRSNDPGNWQGIFIGVLAGGNGTANINSGGLIDGGYQLEVGTRDFFPTGVLNVNTDGTAQAFWATVIGPNGTINMNGGVLNTGERLLIGDLWLDHAENPGTKSAIEGNLNINSGTITVNHNNLDQSNNVDRPILVLNPKSKVTIDNGTLILKQTGHDFTAVINEYVTNGLIVATAGKTINVSYDGTNTTINAQNLAVANFNTSAKNNFIIYPLQDALNIKAKKDINTNIKVSVINLMGKTVIENQSLKNNSGSYTLEMKNKLSTGVYIVKISTENESFSTKVNIK